jgi:hypothetical protein
MTRRKREAVWCFGITGAGMISAVVCVVIGLPVVATVLAFLSGGVAMAGLLDWIDA